MLTVRLPKELEDHLHELAVATRRTKSFFVREAVERYLEDLDDAYVALDRLTKPGGRYRSSDEVKRDLDL